MSIEDFLLDLDRRWTLPGERPLTLRFLGSAALILQTDYRRGTKDGDILQTPEITPTVSTALRALCDKGTDLHLRHGMYLEILAAAFPFLPQEPLWHPIAAFEPRLRYFRVEVLDLHDVVVAKLARFHRIDRDDIAAMVERGLVDAERLVSRTRSAVGRWALDARAEELPRIVRNLHRIERDELFVDESEIVLPGWVGED